MKYFIFVNIKSVLLIVLFFGGLISGCDQNISENNFPEDSLRLLYQTKVPAGYENLTIINAGSNSGRVYLETGNNKISVIEKNGDYQIMDPDCKLVRINQQLALCESGILSLDSYDFKSFPRDMEKFNFTNGAIGPMGRLVYLYDKTGKLSLTDSGWTHEASDDSNLLLWKKGRETLEIIAGHGKIHLGTVKLAGKLIDLEISGENIFVLYLSEERETWGIETISIDNYKRSGDLIEEKITAGVAPVDFAVSPQQKSMVIFTRDNTVYYLDLITIEYEKITLPWQVDYVINLQNKFFAWSSQNYELHKLTNCN
ncbi:MAG: hypothetical protein PF689_12625 [Deltaproteobacteria bacterium]|jgi:hypothetical protein|nr:hypothetical protein [Deltaproteobacteria bacterium]